MDKLLKKSSKIIRNNALLFGTLTGVSVGLFLGFTIKPHNPNESVRALLAYPGELFVRALQLVIVPTIMFSMIVGAASLNIKSNGKIVLRTFTYFFLTSAFNAIFGLILAVTFHPGDVSIIDELGNVTRNTMMEERQNSVLDNFMDMGRSMVPNNIFTAFFEQPATIYEPLGNGEFHKYVGTRPGTNPMGVITYSIVVGIVIAILGEKAKPLLDLAKSVDQVNMKCITGIIWLTPLGVCSIICAKIIEVQNMGTIMASLAYFILTVAFGVLIYQLIIMQLIYYLIVRKNPFKFYIGVLPAAITGFAADSSSAALPVSLKCLDEKVKVDPRISHFVVPIGITVNMDGTSMFVCIASIFIAQINGISLSTGDYISVCMASIVVSVAASTVPSASLTLLFIILNAINVSTKDIGLLFAIDWLVDRIRTTNNVLGDLYTAAVVEHLSRKELDQMDRISELPEKDTHAEKNENSQMTVM